jgi:hypothetical protein
MAGPKFPYPSSDWIGQPSNNPHVHSGCYPSEYPQDTSNVKTWQQKMRDRGWSLSVDGCYGPESEKICRQFQSEKGLSVDGAVGPKTWSATWNAPVTSDSGSSSGGGGGGGKNDTGKLNAKRAAALNWMANHRGITEDPVNSNCDNRSDGIRAAQDRCAGGGTWLRYQPWCGVWCFNALKAAGTVKGLNSNMASVSWIESQAKAGKDPFGSWTTDGDKADPGDLVVLFGSGTHVGMVREVHSSYVLTEEGNTSVGSNGGSAQKQRSRSGETYGYAKVNYNQPHVYD